ncbi:MAG: ParB/RepB/Spo0J family partition protein [Dehalococcoidales bacterium]|nr:ParB/RepB/Spo0J family partition protein [Dehalococcoidales bacterium]
MTSVVLYPTSMLKVSQNNIRKTNIDTRVENLKLSIASEGVKNPVDINREFGISDGQIRFMASNSLGFDLIPGIMRDFKDDYEEFVYSAVSGFHDNSVDYSDKESAIKKLYDIHKNQDKVAEILSISQSTVSNYLGDYKVPKVIADTLGMDEMSNRKKLAVNRIIKNIPEIENRPEIVRELNEVVKSTPITQLDNIARDVSHNVAISAPEKFATKKTEKCYVVMARFLYDYRYPLELASKQIGKSVEKYVEETIIRDLKMKGFLEGMVIDE